MSGLSPQQMREAAIRAQQLAREAQQRAIAEAKRANKAETQAVRATVRVLQLRKQLAEARKGRG